MTESLRAALERIAESGCEAAAFYDIPAQPDLCLDPNNREDPLTGDPFKDRCDACLARAALASTSIDGVSGTGLDVAWAEAEKAVAEQGEQFRLYVRALATGFEAGMALPEFRHGSFVRSEHETPAIALADFTAHVRAALAKDSPSRA